MEICLTLASGNDLLESVGPLQSQSDTAVVREAGRAPEKFV